MTNDINQPFPAAYAAIAEASAASGFTMASEVLTCSLLRTLAASKPGAAFLELGTGTGLSTAWILDGMDAASTLVSVDNDPRFLDIARRYLGDDKRLTLACADGTEWLQHNSHRKFDYIFADTWAGKYTSLDDTLTMLNDGGVYIIDDMLPQPNWPDGHQDKATHLLSYLEARTDLVLTRQAWASGIVVAVKKRVLF